MKMRWFLIFMLFVTLGNCSNAFAQADEVQLAAQYLATGDAQKALDVYQKLFKDDNDAYYAAYVKCLISLKRFDDAEAVTKKMLRKDPDNRSYIITLGAIYTQ